MSNSLCTRFRFSPATLFAAFLVGGVGILFGGSAVHSAETTLGLITRADDTWDLWAWTSSGDNDGIAGYRIEMTGTNLTGHHESPMFAFGGNRPPWDGFVVGREDIPNDNTGNILFAEIPRPAKLRSL